MKCPHCDETITVSLTTGSEKPKKVPERGTRIPPDWQLTEADREFAASKGVQDCAGLAGAFKDYWVGRAGKGAYKVNWSSVWRNWVRNRDNFKPGKGGAAGTTESERRAIITSRIQLAGE